MPEPGDPPAVRTRLELSAVVPGLTGTIDLPPGVAAEATNGQEIDPEGFEAQHRGLRIGPQGAGLELETMASIPPRFRSAAAMAQFHGRYEVVSTHEFGPDHWAVVQRVEPEACMLHGWSGAAGLSCRVVKAPCEQMAAWAEVCGTLRPGSAPNRSPISPESAFPRLDPAAAAVAIAVARAVVRNDRSMLLGAVGPKGIRIGKKSYTAASLEAALASKSVLEVVAAIFVELWGQPDDSVSYFSWNGEISKDGAPKIWFSSGYGKQPYFRLKKTGDAWHVVEFGVYDFGDP